MWPLVVMLIATLVAPSAQAVVCRHKKSGVLKVRDGECRRREIAFAGLVGPPGPAGADGQLRVYGDGSAGARTSAGTGQLEDTNLQYTDFTVPAGATVGIPSGTVIRCTGTFTNNGMVSVLSGGEGGFCAQYNPPNVPSYRPPSLGVALGAPLSPESGTATQVQGGQPGVPLSAGQARTVLRTGPSAGGSGSCGAHGGGPGGGGVTILAAVAIVNNGTISATPGGVSFGGGGGAGGVIVLASRGSITNNGALAANGAAGGEAHDFGTSGAAAGGGGGGGIVHLLAPAIVNVGSVTVAGGPPGATGSLSFAAPTRIGGGGGGACGGAGGFGGSVNGSTPGVASAGEPGLFLQSVLDPTSLF